MVYNVWCMIRTQVYLPEDLKRELELVSKREKKTVAEIVRRALEKEIHRKRETSADTLLKIAAYAAEGPRDLSKNLFDYLYGEKSDFASGKGRKKQDK